MTAVHEEPGRGLARALKNIKLKVSGRDLDDVPSYVRRHAANNITVIKSKFEHPNILVVSEGKNVMNSTANINLNGSQSDGHQADCCLGSFGTLVLGSPQGRGPGADRGQVSRDAFVTKDGSRGAQGPTLRILALALRHSEAERSDAVALNGLAVVVSVADNVPKVHLLHPDTLLPRRRMEGDRGWCPSRATGRIETDQASRLTSDNWQSVVGDEDERLMSVTLDPIGRGIHNLFRVTISDDQCADPRL